MPRPMNQSQSVKYSNWITDKSIERLDGRCHCIVRCRAIRCGRKLLRGD